MKRFILLAAATALLGGCNVGSSTYGTGKTQESQLVSDLASVVSFKKKSATKIDYSERPKLVKPTSTASLPAPIEENRAESAFPVSPEERRASALPSERPRAARPEDDPNLTAEDRKYMNHRGPSTWGYQKWLKKRGKIAKARSSAATFKTSSERKYLTEPPTVYRKAYDTAPVGDAGIAEDSKTFRKKSKGNIFSKLLGRG